MTGINLYETSCLNAPPSTHSCHSILSLCNCISDTWVLSVKINSVVKVYHRVGWSAKFQKACVVSCNCMSDTFCNGWPPSHRDPEDTRGLYPCSPPLNATSTKLVRLWTCSTCTYDVLHQSSTLLNYGHAERKDNSVTQSAWRCSIGEESPNNLTPKDAIGFRSQATSKPEYRAYSYNSSFQNIRRPTKAIYSYNSSFQGIRRLRHSYTVTTPAFRRFTDQPTRWDTLIALFIFTLKAAFQSILQCRRHYMLH